MNDIPPHYIAFLSAAIAAIVSLFINLRSHIRSKEQTLEEITTSLVQLRVDSYSEFMNKLSYFSNQEFTNDKDDEARRKRAEAGVILFNSMIYGKVGLLASYETRETIVHARSVFKSYASGRGDYKRVKKAVWSIHQFLRSDINLRQPGLRREIEKMHKKTNKLSIFDIEKVMNGIQHLDWENHERKQMDASNSVKSGN